MTPAAGTPEALILSLLPAGRAAATSIPSLVRASGLSLVVCLEPAGPNIAPPQQPADWARYRRLEPKRPTPRAGSSHPGAGLTRPLTQPQGGCAVSRQHPAWDLDPEQEPIEWTQAAVEFFALLFGMAAFWVIAWGLAAVM